MTREVAYGSHWRETILTLASSSGSSSSSSSSARAAYSAEDAYFFKEVCVYHEYEAALGAVDVGEGSSSSSGDASAAVGSSLSRLLHTLCPGCVSPAGQGESAGGALGVEEAESVWAQEHPALAPAAQLPALARCPHRPSYGTRTPLHVLLLDEGRGVGLALPVVSEEGSLLSMEGLEGEGGEGASPWREFDRGAWCVW